MPDSRRFRDRTDAGEQLGDALRARAVEVDIVLAIPRGGLPVGRAVADALDVPLDIVVASKIGAPHNPEYALGAVASDGSVWRNERAFDWTNSDEAYFQRERNREAENAQAKADRYRNERSAPDLTGLSVAVVDDGVATGSTVRACLKMLESSPAARVVLAVPVGSPASIEELRALADDVVCLETPSNFRGVGQFYSQFDQVSDEAAMAYLGTDSRPA